MNKSETISRLQDAFRAIETAASSFPEDRFALRPENGKWSAAENLEHLFLTAKAIAGAMGRKDFMLATWGKHEGNTLSYDTCLENYLSKLQQTNITTNPMTPQNMPSRETLLANLHSIHQKLMERASEMTEEELDMYQLPHPLLGLLNCREFLYFTTFHTLHHLETIEKLRG
jgi:hypothetical protein